MKFKIGQQVSLIGSGRYGKVAGYCHYIRPYNKQDNTTIHQGVIVNLNNGFYDLSRETYISMMVCQEDTLENYNE